MKKPNYQDVDGSTAKFLPLINKYVEQQSMIIDALKKYVDHKPHCPMASYTDAVIKPKCNCGLEVALEALNQEKDEY